MRVSLGYGTTATSVPMPIRHAIKLLVGHWYANREEAQTEVPQRIAMGVDSLIAPYRLNKR
jgi:uncharacterized phiE125 gp8 family phage protein